MKPATPMLDDDLADRRAMARLTDGDRAAFDELWHRHRHRLFAFLLRRTGSRQSAEDALQQAFTRVYKYRASYDPSHRFRSWLFGIAANSGHDAKRAELGMWDPLPASLVGDGDLEARVHARDQIARALHQLDGTDRRVLLLTIEGFTSPEVATILEMNQNTVRVRLMRARKRLRDVREANDA